MPQANKTTLQYKPPPFEGPVTPKPTPTGPVTPTTCAADTLRLWNYLPTFVKTADAESGYQFLTWLNGMGTQLQKLDDLCRTGPQGQPGWSIVMDVSRCPVYALPWLAQFVGVRFTNTQLQSATAQRSAIIAEGNFARGTLGAIRAAAAPWLTTNGFVNIIERYPDAYSLLIQVVGDINILTYRDLALAKPHYTTVDSAYAHYDDFPTSDETTVTAAILAAIPAGLKATIEYI